MQNLRASGIFYLVFIVAILVHPPCTFAHGDLGKKIDELSQKIQQYPKDDSLYILRGTLYFQHEQYLKSIRDFEKAEQLVGTSEVIFLGYARSWFFMDELDYAIDNINASLQLNPDSPLAYGLKGDVYMQKSSFAKAAENYRLVIDKNTQRSTEHYIQYVTALDSLGTKTAFQKAIDVLDEGMEDLGRLPQFIQTKVNLLVKQKMYKEAIAAQNELINWANRKEKHLYKRAKLYIKNEQIEEASKDIQAAFEAIDKLPTRYIRSKPMLDLRKHLAALNLKLNEK